MLKISNFKKGDVMTVKCSTGEEVVARFDSDTTTELNVVKPTVLTINPQDGKAMLIPWIMSIDTKSNEPVTIGKSQVVAITKTEKQLSDGYMQSTTGIATATPAESTLLI
tara:strand:+ start:3633 stop:3962 length:330 start_codon:yes stop_codon:yes gene_type:complete